MFYSGQKQIFLLFFLWVSCEFFNTTRKKLVTLNFSVKKKSIWNWIHTLYDYWNFISFLIQQTFVYLVLKFIFILVCSQNSPPRFYVPYFSSKTLFRFRFKVHPTDGFGEKLKIPKAYLLYSCSNSSAKYASLMQWISDTFYKHLCKYTISISCTPPS